MSSRGQEAEGYARRHVVPLEPQQGPLRQDSFCSVWSRKSANQQRKVVSRHLSSQKRTGHRLLRPVLSELTGKYSKTSTWSIWWGKKWVHHLHRPRNPRFLQLSFISPTTLRPIQSKERRPPGEPTAQRGKRRRKDVEARFLLTTYSSKFWFQGWDDIGWGTDSTPQRRESAADAKAIMSTLINK